jgi:hypothetical protein
MKEIYKVIILSTVVLVLASCATSSKIAFHEEVITNDQNDAIVYIYRSSSIIGSAGAYPVKLDDKIVASLKQKAYIALRVTPGNHFIEVGNFFYPPHVVKAQKVKKFYAVPKGVYYFRCQAPYTFSVTKEDAMKEIIDMKYDMGL